MRLVYKVVQSPVGLLRLVASEQGIRAIVWERHDARRAATDHEVEERGHPLLRRAEEQLEAYFASRLREFDLALDLQGTPFQLQVWKALQGIPFGQTRTYAQLARELGNPNATRAVGAANGRNPVAIVVPCHRVIGQSGQLTGFAGGLPAKEHLLHLEAQDQWLFSASKRTSP